MFIHHNIVDVLHYHTQIEIHAYYSDIMLGNLSFHLEYAWAYFIIYQKITKLKNKVHQLVREEENIRKSEC